MRLNLTDTEWVDVLNAERDGLPRCCANISEVRDHLEYILREDGNVLFYEGFQQALESAFGTEEEPGGHDIPSDVMRKIIEQVRKCESATGRGEVNELL